MERKSLEMQRATDKQCLDLRYEVLMDSSAWAHPLPLATRIQPPQTRVCFWNVPHSLPLPDLCTCLPSAWKVLSHDFLMATLLIAPPSSEHPSLTCLTSCLPLPSYLFPSSS